MSAYTTNHTNTQNDLLMTHLMEFYKNKGNLHKMIRIINGESKISLRIVDWFVTNYAKKYYTVYDLPDGSNDTYRFKVYNDYKLKLKAYSKKRLDPFCRWERISIPYDDEKNMETTIGQLNFFKWAIENRIIEFIENHYDDIEADMNARNSTSKRKLGGPNKKSDSLSSHESLATTTTYDSYGSMDSMGSGETGESGDSLGGGQGSSEAMNPTTNSLGDRRSPVGTEGSNLEHRRCSEETFGNDFIMNNNTKTRKKREELSISACKCIKKETVKIVVKFH